MSRSKELCKGIRKKVLGAYESGKGLKKILYKNGCPSKFSPRVKCLMEKEVSKNLLVYSRTNRKLLLLFVSKYMC